MCTDVTPGPAAARQSLADSFGSELREDRLGKLFQDAGQRDSALVPANLRTLQATADMAERSNCHDVQCRGARAVARATA